MSSSLTSQCSRRHCMVVYAYYPHTETRVQRQAEALVRAGYHVDVVCLRSDSEPSLDHYRGVEIHRLPVRVERRNLFRQFLSYVHFFVRAALHMSRLQHRHGYASVQVHNLPDFLVFCAVVPKLQRVPVILDLHDLMPEFFAGRFGCRRRRLVAKAIALQERLACRFADRVITVSDHWRDTLIGRGVSPNKCSVVMNVADEHIFCGNASGHAPSNVFELVYHGTVTYRYGLDVALRAVAQLENEIPSIRLTVLGRGDHMPALVALRRELGLEKIVDLRDEYVIAEHLPAIIGRASLGIVPYRNDVFTDGLLPTKLMEYAVMGVPCVAARTTAMSALFANTVDFFEPGDADDLARVIAELYRNPARRKKLASSTQRFTRCYSWERIGAEYVALVSALGAARRVERSV